MHAPRTAHGTAGGGAALTPSIAVESLVKRYPRAAQNALDGVTFEVAAGELIALLGPNGAGKSTLIGILTTALAPTAGSVRIAGVDVAARPAEVRRHTSFVFQSIHLDLELTVEENARVAAALYGTFPYRLRYAWMSAAYRARVESLAEVLALGPDLFCRASKLSGGTRRRAELLRALLVQPQVLLLDEPTAGLDPATRNELWRHVTDLRATFGSTVLVSTHFLAEAEGADRVLILHRGSLAAEGTPAALRRRFAVARVLLDGADRVALRAELVRLAVPFDGAGPFRISAPPVPAHMLVQALRTPLSALEVHTPTLEEAYLAVTRGEPT